MTPYYEQDGIVIYNCDCSEILDDIPRVSVVCTDPPYGIAANWQGGFGGGWGDSRVEAVERNQWDAAPPSARLIRDVIAKGDDVIIWGGNYFDLPASRCWLVWDKGQRGFSLADAELAWTNLDRVVRVMNRNRMSPTRGDVIVHPTQKPVELMTWCLSFARSGDVLDPFMGSGTTLVAAKLLGRRAVGIEREERYCEAAARRLAQGVLALGEIRVPSSKAEQPAFNREGAGSSPAARTKSGRTAKVVRNAVSEAPTEPAL